MSRVFDMPFSSVYPLYVAKVERKGRTVDELDAVMQASDGDAILVAQKLAQQLGLAVGISSGANVIAAIRLAAELGPEATVVTLLCDSNKKYLSTDLLRDEPVRAGYLAPEIEFVDYHPISRLAAPCTHPAA